MAVVEAALRLALSPRALRKALEHRAHRGADGGITAAWDGVFARKLGRRWRVALGAGWSLPTTSPSTSPEQGEKASGRVSTPADHRRSHLGCERGEREALCPPSGSQSPGAEENHG
jgi:hypothetical protein